MEKKFAPIKYFVLLWIISNSTTHCALKLAFTSPVQIVKRISFPHGFQWKSPNEMRLHIKKVLNMYVENATLDNYISKMFNINNLNPTYVFRLPGGKNRTLKLRKSDFSVAVFPNITNISKHPKSGQALKSSASSNQQDRVKSEEILDELKHERQIFEQSENFEDADYDENIKKIIQKNARNEREFMTFLSELNEDLSEENVSEKFIIQNSGSHERKNYKVQDEWGEMGLEGWSGMMVNSKDELPKKERYKTSKKAQKIKIKRPQPLMSSHEIETEEFNNQLSLLLEDERILRNKTGRLPNVRWPITSTRDQHGDEDIYIARANDPFGHSTKWKFRNLSDNADSHREGRAKRGVLHLYSMIKCATSCDPLQYKGYGCYCGFLGSGRALDGIDRCCKAHDYCYGSANCFFYTEYLVPYLWKCYKGKPLCAIDNGEWGGPHSCASRLCECDASLSKCLRHYYCPRKRLVCTSNPFRLLQNLVMVF